LSNPLRDRFGIDLRLSFYPPQDLAKIIARSARLLGYAATEGAAAALAAAARGTPRIANRLLKRARDFAADAGKNTIDSPVAATALAQLKIDAEGLDEMDRRYMGAIWRHFAGGPVGIENLAAILSEPSDTIEDVIEPYLMQKGFVQRTPRGRILTESGAAHLESSPAN
jgi:Holliday junction DNA helicase RuvB